MSLRRTHSVYVPVSVFLVILSGERDARVHAGRRRAAADAQLDCSSEEHGQRRDGPGLPSRSDDDRRSEHGASVQLGRQAEAGSQGAAVVTSAMICVEYLKFFKEPSSRVLL